MLSVFVVLLKLCNVRLQIYFSLPFKSLKMRAIKTKKHHGLCITLDEFSLSFVFFVKNCVYRLELVVP